MMPIAWGEKDGKRRQMENSRSDDKRRKQGLRLSGYDVFSVF